MSILLLLLLSLTVAYYNKINRPFKKCIKLNNHLTHHDMNPKKPVSCKINCSLLDYRVTDKQCLSFMQDGHIFVKKLFQNSHYSDDKMNILSHDLLQSIKTLFDNDENTKLAAYRHKLKVILGRDDASTLSLQECETALQSIDQTDIPFMQSFNIWKKCPVAHAIVHSPVLARIAADLLHVDAVRIYQDSIFIKRPNDGPTLWHSDLNMCPFDSNDFLTIWIPLQRIPSEIEGGSGLTFATGSHRDFALPYWNDVESTDCSERYPTHSYDSYEVGDVSFHHGWCLHSAPGNSLNETRYAYSISYIVDGAPLLKEEGHIRYPDTEDYQSYADWIDDIGWGGYAEHPLTPLVYAREWEE